MKKPKLYAVAVEDLGILETAAVVRFDGRAWIWLTGSQANEIYKHVRKAEYIYQLEDPKFSTIETRYPRHVMGYAPDQSGRPSRGGIFMTEVMVDASALCRFMEETPKEAWHQDLRLDVLKALVAEAAKLAPKGKETGRGA